MRQHVLVVERGRNERWNGGVSSQEDSSRPALDAGDGERSQSFCHSGQSRRDGSGVGAQVRAHAGEVRLDRGKRTIPVVGRGRERVEDGDDHRNALAGLVDQTRQIVEVVTERGVRDGRGTKAPPVASFRDAARRRQWITSVIHRLENVSTAGRKPAKMCLQPGVPRCGVWAKVAPREDRDSLN